jgi:hypothetical protein
VASCARANVAVSNARAVAVNKCARILKSYLVARPR